MITPFNDHLLVELEKSQWTTADDKGETEDPNAGSGIVVAIPTEHVYLSSYTWVSDASMFDEDSLKELWEKMSKLIGKKVYFEKRAEIGNTIEDGDKTYATIKLSKITAVEE